MHRYLKYIVSGVLLAASLPWAAQAQGEWRWLADPELLTPRRVIGADGGPIREVPNSVSDIDLVDAQTGWATAYRGLLRFDGRWWRPEGGVATGTSLNALDLNSATAGWAVGSDFVPNGPTNIFLYRRNGDQWTGNYDIVRRDGTTGSQSGSLSDVATFADGTAIAIGTAYDQVAPGNFRQRPLLLRFDGSVWRDQTPAEWRDGELTRLSMISPTEGWVVGRLGRPGGEGADAARPAILRLKNGAWIDEPAPTLPITSQPFTMSSVAMQNASNGYAIFYDAGTRCPNTELLRYSNGAWSVVNRGAYGNDPILNIALIPGTDDGWATQSGCRGREASVPNSRLRIDNGVFLRDTAGAQLAPTAYGLLNERVQWAASGGSMMRYSDERLPTAPLPEGTEADARYFPQTGHYIVEQAFLDYYEGHGLDLGDRGISDRESLALFGFPVSESFPEINPDTGEVLTVQYFERARFEYHPNNPDPYKVLLGRLSANSLIRQGRNPANAPAPMGTPAGCTTFNETPYALCPPFQAFWNRSGGLPVFGFPLTSAADDVSATDGKTYQTQWFERERFEYHPENRGTPYEILLGLLGSEELRVRGYVQ